MRKYNVLGIGNAVVDVISQSSDSFLNKMNIEKGSSPHRSACSGCDWSDFVQQGSAHSLRGMTLR